MKIYFKLPIPKDSAWDRKTWRSYTPAWFIRFVDSCQNLIDWFPIIWKDRHWDDYYITKVLQRKIELQREYLVNANRHLDIDRDNKWMTIVLNLLEREHEEYYGMEYMDYIEYGDNIGDPLKLDLTSGYIRKYPNDVRRVLKKYKELDSTDHHRLAIYVSMYRQQKSRNLLFEILKQKSNHWWD